SGDRQQRRRDQSGGRRFGDADRFVARFELGRDPFRVGQQFLYHRSSSCCSGGDLAGFAARFARPSLEEQREWHATATSPSSASIIERILEIRDRWHTKRHPFFLAFGEGKLPLKALGRYQALHYHFVSRALASFGLLYARGYHFEDVRKMIAENIAEEEGLKAIPEPGHEPHDHNELILRFCRAAGLSD